MNSLTLNDLDLLKFGDELTMVGLVYAGRGRAMIAQFPDEPDVEVTERLSLSLDDWEKVLRQTDIGDVRGPNKAILRKGQRIIDNNIAWLVYRRDGFLCRYCGQARPLTVDHVDLWEDGGATVPQNLVSACRPCNKLRGNTPYDEWLKSADCIRVGKRLEPSVRTINVALIEKLPDLRAMRAAKQRSR